VRLAYRQVGTGPGLVLLLHGWPQTGLCWRHVASTLADRYTVVVPDLRGYGDSAVGRDHAFDKRATADDLSQLVKGLGFKSAMVAGHDRGARVAHRWALDRPDDISQLALLDVLPTREVMRTFDLNSAKAMWHWLFHLQPGLPELLLEGHIDRYLRFFLHAPMAKGAIDQETFQRYVSAFEDPSRFHGWLDDYRSGFGIDLERDEADFADDHQVEQPLLVLWGGDGGLRARDVVATWRSYARRVEGFPIAKCGHYLPEEEPAQVAAGLLDFFS